MRPTLFETIQQSQGALMASMSGIRELLARLDKEGRFYAELNEEYEASVQQATLLGRQLEEFKDRAKLLVETYKRQVDSLNSEVAQAAKKAERQAARCRDLEAENARLGQRYAIVDEERRELERQKRSDNSPAKSAPRVYDLEVCLSCGAPFPVREAQNLAHCLYCGERFELDFDGLGVHRTGTFTTGPACSVE